MMAASPVSSGGEVPSPEWETPSDVVVVGVVVRTGRGAPPQCCCALFRRPAGCLCTRLEGVDHEGEQQWWDYIFRLD